MTRSSPGHRVHEQEIVVRRARVPAIVHVFLLGGILDVTNDRLHLFAQVGFRLKNKNDREWTLEGKSTSLSQQKMHYTEKI